MSPSWSRLIFSLLVLLLPAALVAGDCTCDSDSITHDPRGLTLRYKIGAIAAILAASGVGVFLPIVGKNSAALQPGSNLFFLIKAFAAGVILSTGFIHILPDAFENLNSPCLKSSPWGSFPFGGLAAMVGALGTLMVDSFATGYFRRVHFESKPVSLDEETRGDHAGHVHLHTHASHGHAHGPASASPSEGLTDLDRIRYRVTSQVLELGIIVHSVIIGIALGTSQSLDTIKPLLAALCFHQLFEGIGLGGCIAQASFKSRSVISMGLFFSLTTPVGIAVGIGIMNVYNENSPTALIIQGLLDAVAAGILIYMALVDLLAQDFMSPRLQSSSKLFFATNISLLLGAGCMAVLAIWA